MNNVVALQGTITVTGTSQNLPNNPVVNGVVIAAKSGNTASIEIGNSSAVTTTTGFILAAGTSVTVPCSNTNQLWLVGTANDVYSVLGA